MGKQAFNVNTGVEIMPHFCPDVVKVEARDNYILRVWFADGKVFDCNFMDRIDMGVFRKLHDPAFFRLAHAEHGAIVWDYSLDCAPEYVYFDKGVEITSEDMGMNQGAFEEEYLC